MQARFGPADGLQQFRGGFLVEFEKFGTADTAPEKDEKSEHHPA